MEWSVIVAAIVFGALICIVLAMLPGQIACRRKHSKETAIAWCGYLSLIAFPQRLFDPGDNISLVFVALWPVGIIWALTEDNRVKTERRGFPVMPIPVSTGRFRVEGMKDGNKVVMDLDAADEADAGQQAERHGMFVVSVRRLPADGTRRFHVEGERNGKPATVELDAADPGEARRLAEINGLKVKVVRVVAELEAK